MTPLWGFYHQGWKKKQELGLVSFELCGLERLCLGEVQAGGWNKVLGMGHGVRWSV